jgi:hypothetical protein
MLIPKQEFKKNFDFSLGHFGSILASPHQRFLIAFFLWIF